jgi:hypothetical protein
VNSQNNQYWSAKNSRLIRKHAPHDKKVGVWCAISVYRINGPIFYNATVNGARYVNNIPSPFFAQLIEEESLYGVFQQDSAVAHTEHASFEAPQEVFSDHIIIHGLWPPCSPYLIPYDFYLWVSLKDKVYKTNPHTL